MTANDEQVGGTHYKSGFQHWDFVYLVELGYLPAQITRYLARWRKKNGVEDIEKALHYMEKYMEDELVRRVKHRGWLERFIRENRLQEHERTVFNMLVNYNLGDEVRLEVAHTAIKDLLSVIKGAPQDPEFREPRDEWKNS